MADISDVEQTIVDVVAGILYPAGTGQPSALPGAAAVIVHRGWPMANDLDRDLAAGKSHVSVWPRGGTEVNTTPYPDDWQDVFITPSTLTAVVQGRTITIGGSTDASIVQFVTLQIGPKYVASYAVLSTDTRELIAAALASQITAEFLPAVAVGNVITVTGTLAMRAIVGTTGSQLSVIRQQRTQLQITLWCNTPAVRDAIGKLVEPDLADRMFLIMPDQSAARFRYSMTILSDNSEKEGLYRRDMIYNVEYATTKQDTAFTVTSVQTAVAGALAVGGDTGTSVQLSAPDPSPPPPKTEPFRPHTPN